MLISSKSNSKYKELLSIKENRNKDGLILVEGEDLVELAIKNNALLYLVSNKELKDSKYNYIYLSNELYRNLSSYSSLPKIIGVCKLNLKYEEDDKIIYLDGVQDPGNLGTIFRSALAFNFKTIVLNSKCVSPFNFKCVQASKGALFSLNISYKDLKEFKDKGYYIISTSLKGEPLSEFKKPEGKYVLVFGNEGQGISKQVIDLSSKLLYLEMNKEIDSLNVGVCASILMYLFSR